MFIDLASVVRSTRPAAVLARGLALLLMLLVPQALVVALAVAVWLLVHPPAVAVALAVTLIWLVAVPDRRVHRQGWA